MALSDDLDAFFSDFAVDVSAGGTNGKGILDEPTSVMAGDQVIFVDRNVLVNAILIASNMSSRFDAIT